MTTNQTATQTDTEPTVRKVYSHEDRHRIMHAVCARIEQGELIAKAAQAEGVTRSAIWEWARKDAELGDVYARARDASADALAEEALEVARASTAETYGADRVRIDTLKWAAAKRRPKEYGDKQQVEVSGGIEHLHLDALRSITAKARIANDLAPATSPMLPPAQEPYTGPIRGEGEEGDRE